MATTHWDPDIYGQLVRHFAFGWHDLVHLQLWRLFTSPFIPGRRGFSWSILALLVPLLFIAEQRFRSRWTAAIFAFGDMASTLVVVLVGRVAGALGSDTALHAALQRDSGASSATSALAAACATALPPGRVRNSTVFGLVGVLTLVTLIHRDEADIQHLLAAVSGIAIGTLANRRRVAP
jgi:hypothetical protein